MLLFFLLLTAGLTELFLGRGIHPQATHALTPLPLMLHDTIGSRYLPLCCRDIYKDGL